MVNNAAEIAGRSFLLPICYAPNIAYFRILSRAGRVLLERHEHFVKQTYRNHCWILGPNGPLKLTVPLQRKGRDKTAMKDVRITNDEPWQKLHWTSLDAAYRSSPYFEHYEDRIKPLYQSSFTHLTELNLALQDKLLEISGIEANIEYTELFKKDHGPEWIDLRPLFSPKKESLEYLVRDLRYLQVFSDRQPFVPNLSFFDLLFNTGPDARAYL